MWKSSTTFHPTRLKSMLKEIIKLPWKSNLNSKCISSANNFWPKSKLPSKSKLYGEPSMPKKCIRRFSLNSTIIRICCIFRSKPSWSRRYFVDILSENTSITFICERQNCKPSKQKINNSKINWVDLERHNWKRLRNIKNSYRKQNLKHWQKICTIYLRPKIFQESTTLLSLLISQQSLKRQLRSI